MVLTLALPALPTTAATTGSQGTLTITPKHGDQTVETTYDGTFSLYLVATGIETGDITLTDAFKAYTGTTISQANLADETTYKTITQDLAAYIDQRAKDGKTITPDQDDLKAFTQYTLPYGLYLVAQKSAGSTYNACTPILVMIPAYTTDPDGTRHTTDNVTAYPKLTKPGHDNPPGDDNPPGGHDKPTPPTYYGQVALGKSDAETGKALQGVVFNLYKQDKDGKWGVIGTYTTDEKGIIYEDHLSFGDYYFRETQALPGYIEDYEAKYPFTIKSTTETVKVYVSNTPVMPPTPDEEHHIQTGDESHMALYGVVVLLAAAGLVIWIVRRRKTDR